MPTSLAPIDPLLAPRPLVRAGSPGRATHPGGTRRGAGTRPSGSDRVAAARRRRQVARRRRLVLLAGLLAVAMIALGLLTGPGGGPASASGAGSEFPAVTVVVRQGESLWTLAHRHRGEVPHGRYLEMLIRSNGGPSVQAGSVLRLP